MARHPAMIATVLLSASAIFSSAACGGGGKKAPSRPVAKKTTASAPKKETDEDREKKRADAAHKIVPDGSACLPTALKEAGAPRLDVAAINGDLVVCATDVDPDRLLGPVACWKVDLKASPIGLTYTAAMPIPGRGLSVKLDDRCARGYCLPKDEKVESGAVVQMAWHTDGAKVAVAVGDNVHIFDAASKAHEKTFSIRGDKGVTNKVTAVHWVGDVIYVEGDEGPAAAVWAFKSDGAPLGAIESIGSTKPASTFNGSFSVLDKTRVAIAEQGFTTMTIYEGDTGKRSKLVRKLTKPPCKTAELDAFWQGNEGVGAKCKEHMTKSFEHLIGATAVAGSKSLVVALRGARLGELGLVDPKSLAEKSSLKLPWCGEGASSGAAASEAPKAVPKAAKPADEADKKRSNTRAPAAKGGDEDPDAGGE